MTGRRLLAMSAILLTAATALGLAGCATAGGGDAGSGSGGRVSLTYGLWDQNQVPAMKQIIAEFEKKNPNITVTIADTPYDSYYTKLRTAATSGQAPDVFWILMDSLKQYADGGVLMPLNDKIKSAGVSMSNYYPATAQGFTYKGEVYGLPKDFNAFGVFYNKDLFKKAGVPFPKDDWTWSDLAADAKRLTDRSAGTYGIAASDTDVLSYYLTIPQAGGEIIDSTGTKSGYDEPGTIQGLKFWTDLIKDGSSPSIQTMTDSDPLTLFTSGKVAMYYGGSWDPIAVKAVPASLASTGIAPLPKGKNNSFYSNGVGNVISAKTAHPQEAWKFLQFLGSKEAATIQAKTGTVIPAYQGLENEYASSIPQLDLKVLVEQLGNARPIPSSLNTTLWETAVNAELARAWDGRESVEGAARNAARIMNADLAKEKPQK